MGNLTRIQTSQWYLTHLFVKQDKPKVLAQKRSAIRSLDWKPSSKITLTACMLCATRPIDRITLPVGDGYLLERLGLTHLGDIKNRQLAQQLRDMP